MSGRWQELMRDVEQEFEHMQRSLRNLEAQNQRLGEAVGHPSLEEAISLSLRPSRIKKAENSWSLVLSSAGLAKKEMLPFTSPPVVMKSVSFNMSTQSTLEEAPEEEKAPSPSHGILKKKGTSRVAPEIEINDNLILRSAFGRSKASSASSSGNGGSTKSVMLKREDKTAFAILRGQKTKVFVMQKPWYVINPDNSVIATLWQIITTFALLFVALVTPIQVGLMDVQLNWLFVVSLLVDVVFFLDMLLQFFTTYARKTPRGSEWEVRLPKIILHYISTWFLIDLVILIPFELFSFAFPGDRKSVV